MCYFVVIYMLFHAMKENKCGSASLYIQSFPCTCADPLLFSCCGMQWITTSVAQPPCIYNHHSEMRLIIMSRVALICFVVAVLLSSVSEHVRLRASPPNQAQQFQHKFTNKYKNKLGLSWFLHKWKFKVICWAFLDCRLQQWPVVFQYIFVFVFFVCKSSLLSHLVSHLLINL